MYVPPQFAASDPAVSWEIAEAFPFGLLIHPAAGALTPAPWLADPDARVLLGHLSARNQALRALDGAEVKVAFQGPNGYISPRHYDEPRLSVPTWNYVFAVATGRARLLDREATRALLWRLCDRFEGPDGYSPEAADAEMMEELLGEIVGVEVAVERFQPKLKLSQNRGAEEQRRVREALAQGDGAEQALAAWMARRG